MHLQRAAILAALLLLSVPSAAAATPDVSLEAGSAQTCPTGTASYRVALHNPGPDGVNDTYTLAAETPWTGSITFSDMDRQVTVPGGETRRATLWVQPPRDARPGDHGFTVTADPSNTNGQGSATGTVTVLSCYAVDAELVAEPEQACRGQETEMRVRVANTGQVRETFALSTDRGDLARDAVTLEPGAETAVTVTLASDEPVDTAVTVTAESVESYAAAETTARFVAERCRTMDLAVDAPGTACTSGNATVAATVRNTGSVADTYTVAWRDTARNVTLAPGAATTLDYGMAVEPGANAGTVTAASTTLDTVRAEQHVDITGETCYAVDVDAGRGRVTAGSGNQTLLSVDVTNPGTRENTYTATLDGPDWMDVAPEQLTVAPGASEPLTVYIAPDFFGSGDYTAKLVVDGEAVRRVSTINVTAGNGTVVAESTPGVTGAVVTGTSGVVAVAFTAFLLFIGGYWYFRRLEGREKTEAS